MKILFYLKKFFSYRLAIAVFVCGAVVMIFELIGSRLLAPYLGSSLITWTSLIGVILASLSLGYWYGGVLADREASERRLALIIFVAGILIMAVLPLNKPLLNFLLTFVWPLQIKSLLASIWLFTPASVALGMVSPYAVKLRLANLSSAGKNVGSLYALSTLGSLVGTFSAGFWLVPFFGTQKIVAGLAIVLIILALWLYFTSPRLAEAGGNFNKKLIPKFFIFALALFGLTYWFTRSPADLIDQDTAYSRVWIYDSMWGKTRDAVKVMRLDSGYDSAMFLNSDDLVFDYTKYYDLAEYFNPALNKALMIGGAAYSYPKHFLKTYPRAELTVAEIDPAVTALAKKYFRLPDDPRLIIKHADGRVFLNATKDKYDAIFVDAFASSFSIPFQLTTKEVAQKEYSALNDDGLVIVNIVAAVTGPKGRLTRSLYATYKEVFPQVYLLPIGSVAEASRVQNVMLVALKTKIKPNFEPLTSPYKDFLSHVWTKPLDHEPILTDDWAPVDYFISQAL
jgi:spermidine synthase